MDNSQSFEYTYSAREQQEVAEIRKKYLPKEENKIEQLRKLHNSASQKAQAASIAIGVIGALILGTGMSLCLTELGSLFGNMAMLIGILVGLAGMILMVLAYPVYNNVLKRERLRIAPEILRLADELLK